MTTNTTPSKLLKAEQAWGNLVRWIVTPLFVLLWACFWLYADTRYESQASANAATLELKKQIIGVDTTSEQRYMRLETRLDENRKDVIQMGKNIERLLAQNEIILSQLKERHAEDNRNTR
jgi:hypothetical protein